MHRILKESQRNRKTASPAQVEEAFILKGLSSMTAAATSPCSCTSPSLSASASPPIPSPTDSLSSANAPLTTHHTVVQGNVTAMALNCSSSLLICALRTHEYLTFHLRCRALPFREAFTHRSVWCLEFHPCEHDILAIGSIDGLVAIMRVSTKDSPMQRLFSLRYSSPIHRLFFHPLRCFLVITTTVAFVWHWNRDEDDSFTANNDRRWHPIGADDFQAMPASAGLSLPTSAQNTHTRSLFSPVEWWRSLARSVTDSLLPLFPGSVSTMSGEGMTPTPSSAWASTTPLSPTPSSPPSSTSDNSIRSSSSLGGIALPEQFIPFAPDGRELLLTRSSTALNTSIVHVFSVRFVASGTRWRGTAQRKHVADRPGNACDLSSPSLHADEPLETQTAAPPVSLITKNKLKVFDEVDEVLWDFHLVFQVVGGHSLAARISPCGTFLSVAKDDIVSLYAVRDRARPTRQRERDSQRAGGCKGPGSEENTHCSGNIEHEKNQGNDVIGKRVGEMHRLNQVEEQERWMPVSNDDMEEMAQSMRALATGEAVGPVEPPSSPPHAARLLPIAPPSLLRAAVHIASPTAPSCAPAQWQKECTNGGRDALVANSPFSQTPNVHSLSSTPLFSHASPLASSLPPVPPLISRPSRSVSLRPPPLHRILPSSSLPFTSNEMNDSHMRTSSLFPLSASSLSYAQSTVAPRPRIAIVSPSAALSGLSSSAVSLPTFRHIRTRGSLAPSPTREVFKPAISDALIQAEPVSVSLPSHARTHLLREWRYENEDISIAFSCTGRFLLIAHLAPQDNSSVRFDFINTRSLSVSSKALACCPQCLRGSLGAGAVGTSCLLDGFKGGGALFATSVGVFSALTTWSEG